MCHKSTKRSISRYLTAKLPPPSAPGTTPGGYEAQRALPCRTGGDAPSATAAAAAAAAAVAAEAPQ